MTDLDNITPDGLEDALRALRQAEDPADAFVNLKLLGPAGTATRAEKIIRLEDYFRATVSKALADERRALGVTGKHRPLATRQECLESIAADFKIGNADLEAWSTIFHRYLCPASMSVEDLAGAAGVVPQQFRRRMNQGLKYLCALVRREELKATQRNPDRLLRRLPVPNYPRLVGIQAYVDTLTRMLEDPEGPRIVCIEGIGGSGKTTLARAVAAQRAVDGQLADIAWINIRSETFAISAEFPPAPARQIENTEGVLANLTAQLGFRGMARLPLAERVSHLSPALKNTPYLIVVNDVHWLPDYAQLLATLPQISGDTRFLLTSSVSLHRHTYLRVFSVPELSMTSTRELIQDETARRGMPVTLSVKDFDRVYNFLGGNPLALKMFSGHLGRFDIDIVLDVIQRAEGHAAAALYGYIFGWLWPNLSEFSRRVLQILNEEPEKARDIQWIRKAAGIDVQAISTAISGLSDYFLVKLIPEAESPKYSLHPLTVRLLNSGVTAGWG